MAGLAVLGAASFSQADQAVVVGVEEYAPLVAASTLKGCLNDAGSIAEALRQLGFKVTLLTNGKATRQGILDAFASAKKTIKRDERFVFYFAGHGRKAPRFALMPSDATISGNDLEPKDVNEAIIQIPAKSRTVLLDSCFSGGMSAGEMSRGLDDFTSRNFDSAQARSIRFGQPKSQGSSSNQPTKLETIPGICYYTASLDSEQALEATMDDGKRHGLFTYGLLKNLTAGKLWSEVHNDVKKQIGQRLEKSGRTQNPMISTQYMPTEALENMRKSVPKPPPGKTLLDIWNVDNPDAAKLSLKFKPDQDIIEAGKEISLETTIGQDGYLVIVGQVGSKFYQFYPQGSTRAADAKVRKGMIPFPTERGQRLFFDTFGADHVKAMLFATPEKAETVMQALESSGGQPKDVNLAKEVVDVPFTARVSVAVSDALIGGSRLKSVDGKSKLDDLIRKVMDQKTDSSKFIYSKLRLASEGYDKGDQFLNSYDPANNPSIGDREAFMCLLNLAIQAGVLYDANAFNGIKLSANLKKEAVKPQTGNKLWKLNRDLLLALFPEEVNPDDPGK